MYIIMMQKYMAKFNHFQEKNPVYENVRGDGE